MTRYTFGDDPPAIERLALVAAAYEPGSQAFLREHAPPHAGVTIDIGCGPGFSTELVQRVLHPRSLIGVDSSAEFLAAARRRLPGARFELHDVTDAPLPGAPADVLYARLVLAHLVDPVAVALRWLGDLADGGTLLVEDLDSIDAPPGPLRHYDKVSAQVVRAGGGLMYAGAALGNLGGRCRPVTVPATTAATIYRHNVRRWMHDPTLPVHTDTLHQLDQELGELVGRDSERTVSWNVRQLVLRR